MLKKYKDIDELYKIVDIKDDSIVVLENGKYSIKYIYEIKPIILLDLCENQKEMIINYYKEFLRQVNYPFQILVINKEYNYKDYLKQIANNDLKEMEIYNEYVLDMEDKLKKEKLYETFYYIIVSSRLDNNINVENVENSLHIFSKIGCKIEKIQDKSRLIEILNKSINKEW